MQLRYATSLNQGTDGHLGFDAFHTAPKNKLFVLSDGANGTPQGGAFAKELVKQLTMAQGQPWLDDLKGKQPLRNLSSDMTDRSLGAYLYHLGLKIESKLRESAATVILAMLDQNAIRLLGVGDSYAGIFLRKPQESWKPFHWLARHKDAHGNPSQLIGAPVPIEPNYFQTELVGDVCIVLATDGAGDFLSNADFTQTLSLIGNEAPGPEDLNFLTQSLCERALRNGSDDDISLCLIWRRS